MDERLTWEKHGKHMICSKVSAGIGAIKRIRPFVPPATLKLIYNAVVQPSLGQLWNGCQGQLAEISKSYDVQSINLLESLGWKKLELRRDNLKSTFMYNILNNHNRTKSKSIVSLE